MGCGSSKEKETKSNDNQKDTQKTQVLIFGMPDSGQESFAQLMEKHYSMNSFTGPGFAFTVMPSDRSSREKWIQHIRETEDILAQFFFFDISSPASVLLGIRTFNWLKSQLGTIPHPQAIAQIKTPKDQPNFDSLKNSLGTDVHVIEYADSPQPKMQEAYEFLDKILKERQEAQAQSS